MLLNLFFKNKNSILFPTRNGIFMNKKILNKLAKSIILASLTSISLSASDSDSKYKVKDDNISNDLMTKGNFILQLSDSDDYIAGHRSHYSHSSHGSHGSHGSHRSHRSSYHT